MEVTTGVHQLRIPIPNNPLGVINAYLVTTPAGALLLDTGWNTDEAFYALATQMSGAGVAFGDLRYLVITHVHPDHFGLIGRLRGLTDAELVLHEREQAFLHTRYVAYDGLLAAMNDWLRQNGVPDDARPGLERASMAVMNLVAVAEPDLVVRGGEHLMLGDFDFEIVWTPGHSAGHICLYEPHRRLLFAGDHILPDTTPNVSMHIESSGNPLGDYLAALARVASLPIALALPSHGQPFTDVPARVAEIVGHHEQRLAVMLAAFDGRPHSGFEIASAIPWTGGQIAWAGLGTLNRRMAITETLAHLELLYTRGLLGKENRDGLIRYYRV